LITGCAALIALAACWPARAATTLEGYTEAFTQISNDYKVWRLENPKLLAELRIKASPWQNVEGYLKAQALSNKWNGQRWENFFFLKEGHLKFRASRVEARLFSGQDNFWLNEPLLNMVSQDVIKDDSDGPKTQGVRLDAWNIWGLTASAFYTDRSTPYANNLNPHLPAGSDLYTADLMSTEDYLGGRLRRAFLGDRLVLGATSARKESSGGVRDYEMVAAADFETALGDLVPPLARFGRTTLFGEFGRNFSGRLGNRKPVGWKIELRDVGVGSLTMVTSLHDYDFDFYTQGLAKNDVRNNNDYHGHYVEGNYRLPAKAINLKAWRWREKPHNPTSTHRSVEETGGEVYVEFQRGFKGKVVYTRYVNMDGTWPNLLFEVAGENKLAKIRTQFRIKDMGTEYQLRAYGFEADANLTEKWKFYTRLLAVDEKTEARESVFAQIYYRGWQSAEFFVEYGNGDQSNDLANDGDFVNHDSSAITARVFKIFLKLNY
jgi:hypothetical protein